MPETATGRPSRRRWESSPSTRPIRPRSGTLPPAEIYTVRQAAVALGVSTGLADELPRDGFRPSRPADAGDPRARFHV